MRIFDSQIPMTVKVGEANCCGMAVAEYDKKCLAGQAYMDFAKEVMLNMENVQTEALSGSAHGIIPDGTIPKDGGVITNA